MLAYTVQTKAYEIDRYDEEKDEPILGDVETYRVFSTIQIGKYTFVRAVVEDTQARPANARSKEWFVEWNVKYSVSSATLRLTRKMTRAAALAEGERYAALIGAQTFANTDEALAFFDANRPMTSMH